MEGFRKELAGRFTAFNNQRFAKAKEGIEKKLAQNLQQADEEIDAILSGSLTLDADQRQILEKLHEQVWLERAEEAGRKCDYPFQRDLLTLYLRKHPDNKDIGWQLANVSAPRTDATWEVLTRALGIEGVRAIRQREKSTNVSATGVFLRPITLPEYVVARVKWPDYVFGGYVNSLREVISSEIENHEKYHTVQDPKTGEHYGYVCWKAHDCVRCNPTLREKANGIVEMMDSTVQSQADRVLSAAFCETLAGLLADYSTAESANIHDNNTFNYDRVEVIGESSEFPVKRDPYTTVSTVRTKGTVYVQTGEERRATALAAGYSAAKEHFTSEKIRSLGSIRGLFERYNQIAQKDIETPSREAVVVRR